MSRGKPAFVDDLDHPPSIELSCALLIWLPMKGRAPWNPNGQPRRVAGTDARQHPCQQTPLLAGILARSRAVCVAQGDGLDSPGPEAPRPLRGSELKRAPDTSMWGGQGGRPICLFTPTSRPPLQWRIAGHRLVLTRRSDKVLVCAVSGARFVWVCIHASSCLSLSLCLFSPRFSVSLSLVCVCAYLYLYFCVLGYFLHLYARVCISMCLYVCVLFMYFSMRVSLSSCICLCLSPSVPLRRLIMIRLIVMTDIMTLLSLSRALC